MRNTGTNTAIGGGGLHHLAMKASDLDKSLAFYVDGLGFRRAYGWGSDERATGGTDGRAVMLDMGDGNYIEIFAGGTPAGPTAQGAGELLHFALRSTDAEAAFNKAVAAGAAVHMEPRTVPIAGDTPQDFRIAFVKGPDGEVIEFFQNEEL